MRWLNELAQAVEGSGFARLLFWFIGMTVFIGMYAIADSC